jgi:hypothetical protein
MCRYGCSNGIMELPLPPITLDVSARKIYSNRLPVKPRMLIGCIRAIVYFAESSREFIDARKFSMLLAPLM